MNKILAVTLLGLTLIAGVTAGPTPTLAQWAGSSAITNWSGQCSGSTRGWWDDMCMAWRHKMGDKGWTQWWRNYGLVQGTRYADNSVRAWGIDDTRQGSTGTMRD